MNPRNARMRIDTQALWLAQIGDAVNLDSEEGVMAELQRGPSDRLRSQVGPCIRDPRREFRGVVAAARPPPSPQVSVSWGVDPLDRRIAVLAPAPAAQASYNQASMGLGESLNRALADPPHLSEERLLIPNP